MSTSAEHLGLDIEPVVDTRAHRALFSLGAGLAMAVVTLSFVYFTTAGGDLTLLTTVAPFIVVASVAGVGLPVYVASDLIHRHTWLQAAAASCLALFMAFIVFWAAVVVATTGPSGVRVGATPVVITLKFDRTAWLADMSARLAMAQDLCSSDRLRGLTAQEVRAELGEPAETLGGPNIREMCYKLSPTPEQTAAAKAEAKAVLLRVLFSTEGRVASVALGD